MKTAKVNRGYRGRKRSVKAGVILPEKPLKRNTEKACSKKQKKLCHNRSTFKPIIAHLKQDYRLIRNWLKGSKGCAMNLLIAASTSNLKKWPVDYFYFETGGRQLRYYSLFRYHMKQR